MNRTWRGQPALVLLAAILLGSALWRCIMLTAVAPLGADAGYTLMKARLVEQGKTPFADFVVGYGPFQPWLQSRWSALFGHGREGLRLQLWTHHAVALATLLMLLGRAFAAPIHTLLLAAAIYLASVPAFEGVFFVLEPLVGAYGWAGIGLCVLATRLSREPGRAASVAAVLAALASGALAGLAAGLKQVGVVFAVLAVTLPTVLGGPRARRLMVTAALGAVAPYAWLLLTVPTALPGMLSDLRALALYAIGPHDPREPLALRAISLAYTCWIPLALAAAMVVATLRRRFAVAQPVLLGTLAAGGFVLWLPQLLRPYLHYALLPLPFAVVAFAVLLGAHAATAGGRLRAVQVALAAGIVAPLTFQGWIEARLRRELDEERRVVAWIDGRLARGTRLLVVPASPQYYYLTGRDSFDDRYEFFPDPRSVHHAARAGTPVVVVDRSHGLYVADYERELRAAGYERAETLGPHALWRPPRVAGAGPLPELRRYPAWLPRPAP